jgi:polyphosphate kinase
VAPIRNPVIKSYLRDIVLESYLRDNVKARELHPDGSYRHVNTPEDGEMFDSQVFFIGHSADSMANEEQPRA